jgi:hypothetical protein
MSSVAAEFDNGPSVNYEHHMESDLELLIRQ